MPRHVDKLVLELQIYNTEVLSGNISCVKRSVFEKFEPVNLNSYSVVWVGPNYCNRDAKIKSETCLI